MNRDRPLTTANLDFRIAPPRPSDFMLADAKIASLTSRLGATLRASTTLSTKVMEIAALVVAERRRASFALSVHRRLAIAAGVNHQVIEDLALGLRPFFDNITEEIAYDVTETLIATGRVPHRLRSIAIADLGEVGLADLIALVAYHEMMTLVTTAYAPY